MFSSLSDSKSCTSASSGSVACLAKLCEQQLSLAESNKSGCCTDTESYCCIDKFYSETQCCRLSSLYKSLIG